MKILLLNPNTSTVMTGHILAQARRHAMAGTEISAATAGFGGAVIASRVSYAIAAHAVLDMYAGHEKGFDALIVACFGDPGLEALRELSGLPVTGLLEAALEDAATKHQPYAIVTAGTAWVPMLEERIRISPYAALSRGVLPFGTNGLDVVTRPNEFLHELQATVQSACEAGAQAVILGGSALAGFGPRLQSPARLIDPLQSALQLVQTMLGGLGCASSKDQDVSGTLPLSHATGGNPCLAGSTDRIAPIAYTGLSRELHNSLLANADLLQSPANAKRQHKKHN